MTRRASIGKIDVDVIDLLSCRRTPKCRPLTEQIHGRHFMVKL